MLFELEELEASLKTIDVCPIDVQEKIDALREFAKTYDALCELVRFALPMTYAVMFDIDDYDETPDEE